MPNPYQEIRSRHLRLESPTDTLIALIEEKRDYLVMPPDDRARYPRPLDVIDTELAQAMIEFRKAGEEIYRESK